MAKMMDTTTQRGPKYQINASTILYHIHQNWLGFDKDTLIGRIVDRFYNLYLWKCIEVCGNPWEITTFINGSKGRGMPNLLLETGAKANAWNVS